MGQGADGKQPHDTNGKLLLLWATVAAMLTVGDSDGSGQQLWAVAVDSGCR